MRTLSFEWNFNLPSSANYVQSGFVVMVITSLLLGASLKAQVPGPYAGGVEVNFVRSWDALTPQTDPATLASKTQREVRQTTQYLDGLGRPLQTVIKLGSLNSAAGQTAGYDLVNPVHYDAYGREVEQYLPFVAHMNSSGTTVLADNGLMKLNPFQQQTWFYSNSNAESPINGQGDTKYYSKTNYETSPLSRVEKMLPPGDSWVGSDKGVSTQQYTNTLADNVHIWKVTDITTFGDLGAYSSPGIYGAGSLYKSSSIDEMGSEVITYTDLEGKVVLKQVQSGASTWLYTYYIYDDLNQLRAVIQPRGVELVIAAGWVLNDVTILDQQCFRYVYDKRGRMIVKKVPGAEEVRMVYDVRDRLVLTQDGNMRSAAQKKWLYTLYDGLNRPIKTGLMTDNTNYLNLKFHHDLAAGSSSYPNPASYAPYEELTEMAYDTYSALPTGLGISASLNTFYKTNSYIDVSYMTSPNYPVEPIASGAVVGKPTWTKTKELGTASNYLYSVMIYDDKGRVIQTQTTNRLAAVDIVSNQFSWNGALLNTVVRQQIVTGGNQETIVATHYTYDNLWRQDKVEKKVSNTLVNGGVLPTLYKTTTVLKYDALGQLKDKNLGSKPSAPSTPLVNLRYLYNIRGWLLAINKSQVATMAADRYFAYELGYDRVTSWGTQVNQYNGNIAATNWKTAGEDDVIRKLTFNYDKVNRLLSGDYSQSVNSTLNFTTQAITYDANGNIKTLSHIGWKPDARFIMDSLQYQYMPNSNRLLNVYDRMNVPGSLQGDFKTSTNHTQIKTAATTDYSYDVNGNLTMDLNKDIATLAGGTGITYNYLNLPTTMTVRKTTALNRGTITYTYDASGNKLAKQTVDVTTAGKTITTTTNYLAGMVYETRITSPADAVNDYTNRLLLVSHEEGRIRFAPLVGATPAKLNYDYFIKDHLGNVRMVITEDVESEAYPTLSFEGASGSAEVQGQDKYWENKTGATINVTSARVMHSTGTNAMLVRKSLGAIGAAKLLKVMSGDKIHTSVQFYYTVANANNTGANGINSLIANIATLINTSMSVGSVIKDGVANMSSGLSGQTALVNALNTANNTSGANQAPKAYLNILLFNEQFKFDNVNSKVIPVAYTANSWGTLSQMAANAVAVKKNGYAYVYFSNESDELVYFDNFNLTHERGPILEETHYYPYGLTMAGISSKAAGKQDNKYEYNSKEKQEKEFSDGSGIEMYDYGARNYDPQIGRWHRIDNKADLYKNMTPYAYAANQPTNVIDPDGNLIIFINGLAPNKIEKGTQWYWREWGMGKVYDTHQLFPGINITNYHYEPVQTGRAFDLEVSNQLHDENRMYVDGHHGLDVRDRRGSGESHGYEDAPNIIESLHRTGGVIDETIKFVTHSMGGVFGDAYIKGINRYLDEHPDLKSQVMITLVADFDPLQASSIYNNGKRKKQQFIHKGKGSPTGLLANQMEKGDLQIFTSQTIGDHGIMSFFGNINDLQEGVYIYNAKTQEFELQK